MTNVLVVIIERGIMGEIRRDRRGRLTFVYDEGWRSRHDAFPLSLSMPLVVAEHDHARIEPWLWGLLPDNDLILARWAQRFHVSPRNPFALLGAVGEDCAGAVQLIHPERVDYILNDDTGHVDWLTEGDIAERLRMLKKDQAAWRMARDAGQFSLAGAQPKTALHFDGQQWGIPSGRTPTTHILKPPMDGFDGHVENEHLCLALGRALGLPAARSEARFFEDQVAIVVERYDRVRTNGTVRRLHQEDLCQALGLPPTRKYQNEGGPGPAEIIELIRTHSNEPRDDVWTFVRALILNWLIGGTDAHAKNFSMLIGAGGRSRLAPLYDIASVLPYDYDPRKLRLAMKIGGKYRLEEIGRRQWEKFASEVRLPSAQVLEQCATLAQRLPATLSKVAEKQPLNHPIVDRMVALLTKRAQHCARYLSA